MDLEIQTWRDVLFGSKSHKEVLEEVPDLPVKQGCGGASPDCECGFYAYYERQGFTPGLDSRKVGAVGLIEGYGKTTIGPKGFRSMNGKILAICLGEVGNSELFSTFIRPTVARSINKEQVQRNYPTVRFFDSIDDMYAEFPPDTPPLFDPNAPGFWDLKVEW